MKHDPTGHSPALTDLPPDQNPAEYDCREIEPAKEGTAEDRLVQEIFKNANGSVLVKFCRELSAVIIRRYMAENDAAEVKKRVMTSLVKALDCTEQQAECLVALSLELIHARVHGKYYRSNVEICYLISAATGAVTDLSAN